MEQPEQLDLTGMQALQYISEAREQMDPHSFALRKFRIPHDTLAVLTSREPLHGRPFGHATAVELAECACHRQKALRLQVALPTIFGKSGA